MTLVSMPSDSEHLSPSESLLSHESYEEMSTYLTYLDHNRFPNRKYIRMTCRSCLDLLESPGVSGTTERTRKTARTTDLGEARALYPTVDLEIGTCFYFENLTSRLLLLCCSLSQIRAFGLEGVYTR